MAIDEPRIEFAERRGIKSEALRGLIADVVVEDVSPTHHVLDERTRRAFFEIDGKAALAAIDLAEGATGNPRARRCGAHTVPNRRFDLDHVRTEMRHQHRRCRRGEELTEVEHPVPGERRLFRRLTAHAETRRPVLCEHRCRVLTRFRCSRIDGLRRRGEKRLARLARSAVTRIVNLQYVLVENRLLVEEKLADAQAGGGWNIVRPHVGEPFLARTLRICPDTQLLAHTRPACIGRTPLVGIGRERHAHVPQDGLHRGQNLRRTHYIHPLIVRASITRYARTGRARVVFRQATSEGFVRQLSA